MSDERDHYVLVPNHSRTAVLLARGAGGDSLPLVRGAPGAAGVMEALLREHRLSVPFLRTAEVLRDESQAPIGSLSELESAPADWSPPVGLGWVGLELVEAGTVAGPELASHVARWLAEQRGGAVPPERAPWARHGWFTAAALWMSESAAASGLEPNGDVDVVAQWPLSSVLRLDTNDGRVYFKAAFTIFRHEPAITAALSFEHPALVPELVAVDEGRAWLLMRELPGKQMGDDDPGRWADGLRAAATIQQAWIGRQDELFALGVHDRSLAALARDLPGALELVTLPPEDRTRLEAVLPRLETTLERLTAGAVPETLVHGDLHPWNVMVTPMGLRIFDWSDACLSHPFFDLPTYVEPAEEPRRAALVDAYLGEWVELASMTELRELARLAHPVSLVHHCISYQRILDAFEPDDRWWFADEPRRLLTAAIERAEAFR